ncbi:MAG: MBOAT family protein, partial [Deltaproteobacteria bacterium]|nr:MBOAT family protein [Deltaproteobacteria bacterium]
MLLFCTMITYSTAILMDRFSGKREKKILLLISIVSNFGLLCFYKYLNFANESLETLLSYFNLPYHIPHLEILLPLGISFFTLQAVSYSLDVYRGNQTPERHFGVFSLYLAFFPKLISGPIERASHLLPQLKRKADFDAERIFSGLRLLLWGIFKKTVIADRLGIYVNMVFNHPHDFSGQTLILAAWFYTLQIYCDFSGYTDMAICCGRVFGIELSQNFNFPYFARNIAGFWRRWHMTLTRWLRDYLYIPLGGNRRRPSRWRRNILIVFVLCGLWHGANWTFVLWGVLHGFYYLFGRATIRIRTQCWTSIGAKGGLL